MRKMFVIFDTFAHCDHSSWPRPCIMFIYVCAVNGDLPGQDGLEPNSLQGRTFRPKLEKGLGADINHYDLIMIATHPGDKRYKPAVQQAELDVPLPNTEGAHQTISGPAMLDQK